MLVKLYYCVLKLNKDKILAVKNQDNLIQEIRNVIIPGAFADRAQLSRALAELSKVVKAADMVSWLL